MPIRHPLPAHPDIVIESEETVWDGRFPLQLVKFRNRRFDGQMSGRRQWEWWHRGRAAALLPYDPVADAVLLIEQFRLPALAAGLSPVLVEIPAGLCDANENAADAARRETIEEIAVTPRRMLPIGEFMLLPGGCDERISLYVGEVTATEAAADGLIGHGGLASEEEDIRVRRWPAERAIAAALAGEFTNSVTTITLLWLAAKRGWLCGEWRKP